MTRKTFISVITSWNLAIIEYLNCGLRDCESIRDMALQYNGNRCTKEEMDEVAECFNWDLIYKMRKEST